MAWFFSDSLVKCALRGDIKAMQAHLDKGADINKPEIGKTPLMGAAHEGHADATTFLLSKGADFSLRDKHGWSALKHACWQSRPAVVRLLLDAGADANETDTAGVTPLMTAVRVDHHGKVDAGVGHLIEQLLPSPSSESRQKVVRVLVDHGARLDAKSNLGLTALMYAAHNHLNAGAVTVMLAAGAPPGGAVWFAASSGSADMLRFLIDAGLDINERGSHDWTPLMAGVSNGHGAVVDSLIKAGADLAARDADGNTAYGLSSALHSKQPLVPVRLYIMQKLIAAEAAEH